MFNAPILFESPCLEMAVMACFMGGGGCLWPWSVLPWSTMSQSLMISSSMIPDRLYLFAGVICAGQTSRAAHSSVPWRMWAGII